MVNNNMDSEEGKKIPKDDGKEGVFEEQELSEDEELNAILEESELEENLDVEEVDVEELLKEIDDIDGIGEDENEDLGIEFALEEDFEEFSLEDDEYENSAEGAEEENSVPEEVDYFAKSEEFGEVYDASENFEENFVKLSGKDDKKEKKRYGKFLKVSLLIFISLSLLASLFLGMHLFFSKKFRREEIVVARAVADISMALMNAKVVDGTIGDVNDKGFIAKHLEKVLLYPYFKSSSVYEDGKFSGDSHSVNFFVANDFSYFVVFADPVGEGFPGIFAKRFGVVLESNSMQIFTVKNVKKWKQYFHGHSGHIIELPQEKVEELLYGSYVFNLDSLDENEMYKFKYPKNLSKYKKNVSQVVYQSPRFYGFTQNFANKLLNVEVDDFDESMMLALQRMERVSEFVFFVNENSIENIFKVFVKNGVDNNFLFGKVELDSATSKIVNVTIVSWEDLKDIIPVSSHGFVFNQDFKEKLERLINSMIIFEGKSRDRFDELCKKFNDDLADAYKDDIGKILSVYCDQFYNEQEGINAILFTIDFLNLYKYIDDNLQRKLEGLFELLFSEKLNVLMNNISQAKALKDILFFIKKAKAFVAYEFQDNGDEILFSNRLKNSVMNKLRNHLFSVSSENEEDISKIYEQVLLDEIFYEIGADAREKRKFFLEEFDNLASRIKGIVSSVSMRKLRRIQDFLSRSLLDSSESVLSKSEELHYDEIFNHLDEQQQLFEKVQRLISQIPIRSLSAFNIKEQRENHMRLGFQILVEQSLKTPSEVRDRQLMEGLELLTEATEEDRLVWEQLLEGRRMLTETPEICINKVFNSKIGFYADDDLLILKIKKLMERHLDRKKRLMNPMSNEQFLFLKKLQGEDLAQVVSYSEIVKEKSLLLKEYSKEYMVRLETFASDYSLAKEEGLFSYNPDYHNKMYLLVFKKIEVLKQWNEVMCKVIDSLVNAAQNYEDIANDEIENLNSDVEITTKTLQKLQSDINSVTYPYLNKEDLPGKFHKLTKIEIVPINFSRN